MERHAAVSVWEKGPQAVAMLRAGRDDPGVPPQAKLLKQWTIPVDAKSFFAIEAGAKR